MSKPVDLDRLAAAIDTCRMDSYLLTSGDDGRPHTTAIRLRWHDGVLVGPCGRTSAHNATERPAVSLMWPPNEPGGYSLIVDATAQVADGEARLIELTPVKALWHRPAEVPDPTKTCAHDCKPV